ncbi:TetR/AcrR family transcriptional regulator [Alcanivorax sp. 1008]|uniref:TetR/AcrR family transcriptional regulator n=1 Tax=Alcanivorax sp. 1008 TaxID=2816853 RepID=UPI001D5CF75A|nr:TetR/AcrR family transcriptional regulator [Alcanivorax sp. 1008]MCC1497263.1 TetR/AcrR family transcriptional regulator [Alcanivorax sp. 1008]
MGQPSTRDTILDAAQRIAAERGAGRITLDEVAKESGLSKGGLLYHFAGKEALIKAMLERLIERSSVVREEHASSLVGKPHATLRAMLATRNRDDVLDPHVAMAILAAAAEQPTLLDPLRQHIAHMREQIIAESGDHPAFWLLWAAADGLLFQQLLGVEPYLPEQRDAMHQQLQLLAEGMLK